MYIEPKKKGTFRKTIINTQKVTRVEIKRNHLKVKYGKISIFLSYIYKRISIKSSLTLSLIETKIT